MCAEESHNRTRALMEQALRSHLTRPPRMAMDSALQNRALPSGPKYGDQLFAPADQPPEYNQGDQAAISGEDCLQFVRLCLQKLPDPDRKTVLMGLADLISTEPTGDNALNNNRVRSTAGSADPAWTPRLAQQSCRKLGQFRQALPLREGEHQRDGPLTLPTTPTYAMICCRRRPR